MLTTRGAGAGRRRRRRRARGPRLRRRGVRVPRSGRGRARGCGIGVGGDARTHLSARRRCGDVVPEAEVSAGQAADAEITLTNAGRGACPRCSSTRPTPTGRCRTPAWARLGPWRPVARAAELAERPRPGRDGFAEAVWTVGHAPSARPRPADRGSASPVSALGPGDCGHDVCPCRTAARGLLTLSDVGVWCVDPFGLLARRVTVAPPAHVIVYPELATHRRAPSDSGRRPGRQPLAGAVTSTHALSGDELSGLAPLRAGRPAHAAALAVAGARRGAGGARVPRAPAGRCRCSSTCGPRRTAATRSRRPSPAPPGVGHRRPGDGA